MADLLKSVDMWFLIFLVIALAGVVSALGAYFLWSVKNLLNDLKDSINELKETIKELFDHRNDHETRIKVLETRMKICAACNETASHAHRRVTDDE